MFNDPDFGCQWALDNFDQTVDLPHDIDLAADFDIDAPEAWAAESIDPNDPLAPIVAVLDSGIDLDHEDLAPALWTNPGEIPDNAVDDDSNGEIDDVHGWNFVDDNADIGDGRFQDGVIGHGSQVAGLIGAVQNNELGVSGAAPGVRLMALKFMPNGTTDGDLADASDGIEYGLSEGARVFNMSVGDYSTLGPPGSIDEVIENAPEDAVFVASAGNESTDLTPLLDPLSSHMFPCEVEDPKVVCVGAVEGSGAWHEFSNYGPGAVDLAAPGTDLYTTGPAGDYVPFSGTSGSAPLVAAAAALRMQDSQDEGGASGAEIVERIEASTVYNSALEDKVGTSGVLNLLRVVADSYVTTEGSRTEFTTDPGLVNSTEVTPITGGFEILDDPSHISGSGDCEEMFFGVVDCTGPYTEVVIDTGDEDDYLSADEMPATGPNISLQGGEGEDTVLGGDGDDHLTGGAGVDTLTGGEGADVIEGNGGVDDLDGQDGDDIISGGTGVDTIAGGTGTDAITGGDGEDTISGGGSNDTIYAVDGDADMIDCGAGTGDTAWVDPDSTDTVTNCEDVLDSGFGTSEAVAEMLARNARQVLPLDETSGGYADTSGYGHNATVAGTPNRGSAGPFTGCSTDYSVDLDGTGDYLETSYSPFAAGSQRTYMGWAKRDGTGRDALFGSDSGPYTFLEVAGHQSTGNRDVSFSPNWGTTTSVWADAWPSGGGWVHWALTFDDSANTAELFIDGVSQGAQTNTGSQASGANLRWGTWDTGSGIEFDGQMALPAVFEQVLTESQIAAIATADGCQTVFDPDIPDGPVPAAVLAENPSQLLLMKEVSGLIWDRSTNSNHGSVQGNPTRAVTGPFASDPSLKAIDLDGSGDYISTSYSPFAAGSSRTYMGWAKRDGTGRDALFGSDGGNFTFLEVAGHQSANSDDVSFSPDWGTTTSVWTHAWPSGNGWVNWALTFNDSTNTAEFFIDGVSQGTRTNSGSQASGHNLRWGAWDTGYGIEFDGKMAMNAVYGSILSQSEIEAITDADVP